MLKKIIYKTKFVAMLAMIVSPVAVANTNTQYQELLIPFIQNKGQIKQSQVDFYANTFGGTLFVTDDNELVYRLPYSGDAKAGSGWAFKESFINSNPSNARGEDKSGAKVSYFKGADVAQWKSNLPAFRRINLGEVYQGIQVRLQVKGNNIEKLFYIKPQGNPKDIQIAVKGVNALTVNPQNQLALRTDKGDILFTSPVAFQIIEGEKRFVEVAYAISKDRYGFKVGDYDVDHELIIDPLLASTYLGGDNPNPGAQYNDDIINTIAAQDDSVYVAGVTQSTDFPVTLGGYDQSYNGSLGDAFVTKLSSDLSTVIASTYIGTNYRDNVKDMLIDANGTIYITGDAGYGFPVTAGGYTHNGQPSVSGSYVAALSSDLSSLIASSIPVTGGVVTIAEGNGGIYFGGSIATPSLNVTPDAYDSTCGNDGLCDPTGSFNITTSYGFGGQLSSDLSALLHLSYLDEGRGVTGIAVSPDTSVYISDGFEFEGRDGYVARFDAGLTSLLSTAPFDSFGRTYFYDVAVGNGYVVAVGESNNPDVLPANGSAFDSTCGTDGACNPVGPASVPIFDSIVARFSPDLQTVEAFSFLGGTYYDRALATSITPSGSILVAGQTRSVDFPVSQNAYDSSCGTDGRCDVTGQYNTPTQDTYIAHLSSDLSSLIYASYLGGSGTEYSHAVATGNTGQAYIAGHTASTDFPTTSGAFDTTYSGGTSDAYISLFDVSGDSSGGGSGGGATNVDPFADSGSSQVVRPRVLVYLDGTDSHDPDGQIVSYKWKQVSGKSVRLKKSKTATAKFKTPKVKRGKSKVLVFELTVADDKGASNRQQVTVTVRR